MNLSPISEIIEDFSKGHFIILVDNDKRENEGDIMCAADFIDGKKINFMMRQACGLVCLAMSAEKIDSLKLPLMKSLAHSSAASHHAAFTYSIEAKNGVTTGISAFERAITIKTATALEAQADDLVSPGHVFPLKSAVGGLGERQGHTEAAVELAKIIKANPATVICEIIDQEGFAASHDYLDSFAQLHQIKMGTIDHLIKYIAEKKAAARVEL